MKQRLIKTTELNNIITDIIEEVNTKLSGVHIVWDYFCIYFIYKIFPWQSIYYDKRGLILYILCFQKIF